MLSLHLVELPLAAQHVACVAMALQCCSLWNGLLFCSLFINSLLDLFAFNAISMAVDFGDEEEESSQEEGQEIYW